MAYIEEPNIIMFGCRSLTNERPTPGDCRVCGTGIREGHDHRYCAICDSLSPRLERQVKAARRGEKLRDRAERANKKIKSRTRELAKATLTESHRRQIWNGYRSAISTELEVTNLSKVGRDFLTAIGQVPDWSVSLKSASSEGDR